MLHVEWNVVYNEKLSLVCYIINLSWFDNGDAWWGRNLLQKIAMPQRYCDLRAVG